MFMGEREREGWERREIERRRGEKERLGLFVLLEKGLISVFLFLYGQITCETGGVGGGGDVSGTWRCSVDVRIEERCCVYWIETTFLCP